MRAELRATSDAQRLSVADESRWELIRLTRARKVQKSSNPMLTSRAHTPSTARFSSCDRSRCSPSRASIDRSYHTITSLHHACMCTTDANEENQSIEFSKSKPAQRLTLLAHTPPDFFLFSHLNRAELSLLKAALVQCSASVDQSRAHLATVLSSF